MYRELIPYSDGHTRINLYHTDREMEEFQAPRRRYEVWLDSSERVERMKGLDIFLRLGLQT
jgi:hypothetical protein